MKETFMYRSHSIDLELSRISQVRIRWTYFIDGDYCSQGMTGSLPIDTVRGNALALARKSIEVLDSMGSGHGDAQSYAPTGSRAVSTMMNHGAQRFAVSQ